VRSEAVIGAGFRVCGSIDLIERHRKTGALRITDHKTGRPLEREPAYIARAADAQHRLGVADPALIDKAEV